VVRLLQQSQHHTEAIRHAASAIKECTTARDDLTAAQLLHLQAGSFSALGDAAGALNALRGAQQRYARLSVSDERAWLLHLDAAAARERLGLRGDAAEAWGAALEAARQRVHELGLAEMVVSQTVVHRQMDGVLEPSGGHAADVG
jgi:hypothetical protein